MKKILLLVLLFNISCKEQAYYDELRAKDEAELSAACAHELGQLYPGYSIKEGAWVQRYDWRTRLYLVGGRIFQCRQSNKYNSSEVKLTPVEFTE